MLGGRTYMLAVSRELGARSIRDYTRATSERVSGVIPVTSVEPNQLSTIGHTYFAELKMVLSEAYASCERLDEPVTFIEQGLVYGPRINDTIAHLFAKTKRCPEWRSLWWSGVHLRSFERIGSLHGMVKVRGRFGPLCFTIRSRFIPELIEALEQPAPAHTDSVCGRLAAYQRDAEGALGPLTNIVTPRTANDLPPHPRILTNEEREAERPRRLKWNIPLDDSAHTLWSPWDENILSHPVYVNMMHKMVKGGRQPGITQLLKGPALNEHAVKNIIARAPLGFAPVDLVEIGEARNIKGLRYVRSSALSYSTVEGDLEDHDEEYVDRQYECFGIHPEGNDDPCEYLVEHNGLHFCSQCPCTSREVGKSMEHQTRKRTWGCPVGRYNRVRIDE